MLYNTRTQQFVECYYRRVGTEEVKEYVPPRWVFDFQKDFDEEFEVFILETKEYPGSAQGVISLKIYKNEFRVYLKSAEASAVNKLYRLGLERNGLNDFRIYKGVGANLVAFACQYSLENNCDGYVNLISKTETVSFYTSEELGGKPLSRGSQTIIFNEEAGTNLARKYFPGGAIQWVE
ncbi:hypothetical protein [Bacillus sp. FJAT-27251]|uniref:hypothetical protein n=1 Tax=Bacillus sp. FJAT-27251 TaxID=1684142 RepID=UPI0006A76BC8|nr:hypothetical protein [Bacillus sp. FJAT-27251]